MAILLFISRSWLDPTKLRESVFSKSNLAHKKAGNAGFFLFADYLLRS